MTTIAYRDGVMAGDSGCWLSNVKYSSAIKVAKGHDGSLHGVAGTAGDALGYLKWVTDGMCGEPPKPDSVNREEGRGAFVALVIPPKNGLARLWTAYGWEDHHDVSFIAIGAGAEMAIGAMAAGASAERAVEIVAGYSNFAALPVRCIRKV